jgi:hypothetical protein
MNTEVEDGRGCQSTAGEHQFAEIDIEGQQPATGTTGKIKHGDIVRITASDAGLEINGEVIRRAAA